MNFIIIKNWRKGNAGVILTSQSGETGDTIAALKKGARV